MDFSALMGLATAGAGVLFGRSRKGGASDAWQKAAETYGLLHKPSGFWSGPKLSGSLSGNELTVDLKNRNSASAATRFRLGIQPLDLGLRLRKKRFWNSLRPRIRVGDKAFDNQVVVDARNEFAAREFLTSERRAALRSFLNSFKGAVVTDDEISFTTRGHVKKSDEMIGAIDAMMHVADVLSEESHATSVTSSEIVPIAAITATDTAEAAAPEREAEEAKPRDAEPAPEPEREPEPEPGPEPEPVRSEPHGGVSESPDMDEFCDSVFAPGALSFAATQTFKQGYQGKRVAWTGTLESVAPYTFDFDFGSGAGLKATAIIRETGPAESRDIRVVIGLPAGVDGLAERIGQPVTFTGRLLKVDGLARKVLIGDAEIGR